MCIYPLHYSGIRKAEDERAKMMSEAEDELAHKQVEAGKDVALKAPPVSAP